MNAATEQHDGHLDAELQRNTVIYTARCSCGWASAPTDYRTRAVFDDATHYLEATRLADAAATASV